MLCEAFGVVLTVCPLVSSSENTTEDSRGKELSNDPAEVDVCAEVGTKSDRADFGSVGSGKSLENAPRDTAQDFADEEGLDVVGEEGDEDECDHHCEGSHHGLAVAKLLGDDTVDEETEDLTAEGAVAEAGFPWCGDSVGAVAGEDAVFLVELREGVEGGEKDNVVAFHDDGCREEQRPSHCLGVELQGLHETHLVFLVRGIFSFSRQISKVRNCL